MSTNQYTQLAQLGRTRLGPLDKVLGKDGGVYARITMPVPAATGVFTHRARTLRDNPHPNICQVFAAGMTANGVELILEYVEGPTLTARLEQGDLSAEEADQIWNQLQSALAHMHELGLVHGEVTTDNVLLPTSKRAVLIDLFAPMKYSEVEQVKHNDLFTQENDLSALDDITNRLMTALLTDGRVTRTDATSENGNEDLLLTEQTGGSGQEADASLAGVRIGQGLQQQAANELEAQMPNPVGTWMAKHETLARWLAPGLLSIVALIVVAWWLAMPATNVDIDPLAETVVSMETPEETPSDAMGPTKESVTPQDTVENPNPVTASSVAPTVASTVANDPLASARAVVNQPAATPREVDQPQAVAILGALLELRDAALMSGDMASLNQLTVVDSLAAKEDAELLTRLSDGGKTLKNYHTQATNIKIVKQADTSLTLSADLMQLPFQQCNGNECQEIGQQGPVPTEFNLVPNPWRIRSAVRK
ncbi:hypothetical protein BK816_05350 [Boudabousia tangfeifanii]|uniref:Protein kinase domain-containing protein n=1 Tax=Boudabousia tangfeifanii TaxID=1912795 RepID=A0A1D9MKW5_9ACTO|nr:protein kinase [Boudabousia tangfeifanii]AOZ72790.1 hypothetical protein BK816_05350 [Boudabousia tangfeifanii]